MPATEQTTPAAPSREMVAALLDFELASMRLEAMRGRVVREGMSREIVTAITQTLSELSLALCAIDSARRVPA